MILLYLSEFSFIFKLKIDFVSVLEWCSSTLLTPGCPLILSDLILYTHSDSKVNSSVQLYNVSFFLSTHSPISIYLFSYLGLQLFRKLTCFFSANLQAAWGNNSSDITFNQVTDQVDLVPQDIGSMEKVMGAAIEIQWPPVTLKMKTYALTPCVTSQPACSDENCILWQEQPSTSISPNTDFQDHFSF